MKGCLEFSMVFFKYNSRWICKIFINSIKISTNKYLQHDGKKQNFLNLSSRPQKKTQPLSILSKISCSSLSYKLRLILLTVKFIQLHTRKINHTIQNHQNAGSFVHCPNRSPINTLQSLLPTGHFPTKAQHLTGFPLPPSQSNCRRLWHWHLFHIWLQLCLLVSHFYFLDQYIELGL